MQSDRWRNPMEYYNISTKEVPRRSASIRHTGGVPTEPQTARLVEPRRKFDMQHKRPVDVMDYARGPDGAGLPPPGMRFTPAADRSSQMFDSNDVERHYEEKGCCGCVVM